MENNRFCRSLGYLSLAGNPLHSIPSAIASIRSLSMLDLSMTHLTQWKDSPMSQMPELRTLYLRNIRDLTEFGDCAFCGLTELRVSFSGLLAKWRFVCFNSRRRIR
jgi:hypothetical protein